jgi:transposase InsO family protein
VIGGLIDQKISGLGLSISRLCELANMPRRSYYQLRVRTVKLKDNLDLRDQIQRVAVKWPSYGYRRITRQLAREGIVANHKLVLGLMRTDNLLCLRKKGFVRTTNSAHQLPVYPNLARNMILTGTDQLWVADITYIRLRYEFIYLAVILDAFSRRCIGWTLDRHLDPRITIAALRMAISTRDVRAGLVHHSDRGVQYASKAYTGLLMSYAIVISMSRRGNPYDNAKAERFMRTLKYEEVYMFDYDTLTDARHGIRHFIEEVYNRKRLHSAIGYVPPVEFEQTLFTTTPP